MEERKIWASAFLLIDRNGDDAADHALKQVNELWENGDAWGAAVWFGIVTAIRKIEASGLAGPIH